MKLSFHFKGFKKGSRVYQTTRQKKATLLSKAKANFSSDSMDKVYIRVIYGRGRINEGYYFNFKDFKNAYLAFTSKPQLDFIEQYWKGVK